ncbi:OmpA family protein [Sphingomonas sp. C3-2]|uniref:OmpA family protein n=1 Tax=Sphingomonas sp. C3-2 TaxID=3062169 RepID=UPI00294B4A99|nr:OmpA family protein [Sphingomonas sp. C3-2]WOK38140.1 OmpA family protein [Sphingomonas sp. C3-2]
MRISLGAAMLAGTMTVLASPAAAQATPRSPLLELDRSELRTQIQSRFDTAVRASQSPEIKRSEDSRYIWASEAKVQCGIALGYLKSGRVDEESINKCDAFSARLAQIEPVAPTPVATGPVTPPACAIEPTVSVFFDWNSEVAPAEAQNTIQQIAASREACGFTRFTVTGHADSSGGDAYNLRISERRANAVAGLLESAGIPRSDLTVTGRGESELKIATADGVREPMNRRVEISASGQ